MTKVIVGMTLSLDGFVADQGGSPERLYPDLVELRSSPYMAEMVEETGAALMGKRTFDMADDPNWYVGNYELQVPIFVVTHDPPAVAPRQDEHLSFTFVSDGIESAVTQAKAVAGERAVTVVGGVSITKQLLHGGLADELRLDVMPVLLGAGQRFFEDGGPDDLRLEKISVQEVGARTSLRFRIVTSACAPPAPF